MVPQGRHGQGKVREKSGKNKDVLRSGKIFDIVKVSEKSEFCFTIYSS